MSGPINSWFPIPAGDYCDYEEILVLSGAGAFNTTFNSPYMYVTDQGTSGDGYLLIYDMTDPSGPVLMSYTALPTDSMPTNPRYMEGMLFIPYWTTETSGPRCVAIWNVDNPSSPVLIGETDQIQGPTGRPRAVEVVGTDLFIACTFSTNRLEKHDISDPANPVFTASLVNSGGVNRFSIKYANDVLYVYGTQGSGGPAGVETVNPSTLGVLDTINNGVFTTGPPDTYDGAMRIHSDNQHLFALEGNGIILWVIDCSDPSNLSTIIRMNAKLNASACNFWQMVLNESTDRLYCGHGTGANSAIQILDISDLDNPTHLGTINTSGDSVTDLEIIPDGCAGFAWCQGSGAAVHLLGIPPIE